MKTPVKIAVAVLVLTQIMNVVLVPWLAHAGLALSIGLAALVNASWLLVGLLRKGAYQPAAGWGKYLLQVAAASALLAAFLVWGTEQWDWQALKAQEWQRVGLMVLMLAGSAVIYFGALRLSGLKLRHVLRR